MLSIEIRVNGSIITVLNAINTGLTSEGLTDYEYQGATWPMNNAGAVQAFQGYVEHRREDGIEKLAALLCEDAARQR